jgi:glycosyltransferase involved in cell wall biosynthesis
MNVLKDYLLFNPHLKNSNLTYIKKKYIEDLNNNDVVSIDTFFKRYKDFDIDIYKKFNKEVENYSNIEIMIHMHNIGSKNDYIYSLDSFYKKYPKFNLNNYKKIYNSNNINEILLNYHNNSNKDDFDTKNNDDIFEYFNKIHPYFDINNYKFFYNIIDDESYSKIIINIINDDKIDKIIYSEYTFYKLYPSFNIKKYRNIENSKSSDFELMKLWYHSENKYEDLIYNNNPLLINNLKNKKKLAHIFVHFFKIGGGESYLQNFNKINSIFDETLFINNNYNNETLFNFNGDIIFYTNYNVLNNLLKNYDIILDHQLYWFDKNNTFESFKNISSNKIFRITHGVPIHFQNITDYNYSYSIELYNETLSDKSWNNHIKIYNNIGVEKNIKKCTFKNSNLKINIACVGRINEDKIPITFLKILTKFLNIHKKYIFNFYGLIDDSYFKYFNNEINKVKNIKYYGVIDPKDIKNIYLNNDILMHPSKSEAGATVVLEAMSYGLPIICKNTGGLPNALGSNNINYLCNNDQEMFEKLLLINEDNYKKIFKNNIFKILNHNNITLNKKLIDTIDIINNYENSDNIPNIIHYIFGLKKQKEEFYFVYYLSILSNYLINKPDIIYFHYQYEPYGYWWEKAKKYIKLNYVNANGISWGSKKIIKYAHKADKLRLDILYKYGGIYMDIDTITYKSYEHLLNYDFVMGIQDENYGTEKITLYCNAILLCKKNNIFLKKWIDEYEKHFIPSGWCEASVFLPHKIYDMLSQEEKLNIKILDKNCFYYPSYYEVDKIFENELLIDKNLLTLHLWNSYSEKYYKSINNFNWIFNNNSLYSSLIKNIYNIINPEKKIFYNDFYTTINKIYSLSIISIYKSEFNNNYEKMLYSLLDQEYLFLLNIELIILDNSEEDFYNIYNNNNLLKEKFLNNNIDIKIISLTNIVKESYSLNIGLEASKYDLVTFCDFDTTMYNNRLINQVLNYNNMLIKKKNNAKILYNKSYENEKCISIISKDLIINIINNNNLYFNINSIIFNKKDLYNYFPLKYKNIEEMNIIFIILNCFNNIFVNYDDNIINLNNKNNIKDESLNYNFKYLIKNITDNIIDYTITTSDIINNDFNSTYYRKISDVIIKIYYENNYDNLFTLEYIKNIYNF